MKILVTGAAGYVGRAVVAEAQARGHDVWAFVRSGDVPGANVVRGDVMGAEFATALEGVEAVIHTAASLSGDDAVMMRDTVEATKALMRAVAAHPNPPRVVLAGSMSVYGADCAPNSVISEDSPRETRPALRDGYTRAKLAQEDVVMAAGLEAWVLRIGAVFGPTRLWNGHLGLAKGPVLLAMGRAGDIPLSHVSHAARALVLAAQTPARGVEIVNVVDEDLPTRMQYVDAMKAGGWPRLVIPAPWRVFAGLGAVLSWLPGLPGLLRGPVLRARMMPLRYSNARLKERLGWAPILDFDTAMADALREARA